MAEEARGTATRAISGAWNLFLGRKAPAGSFDFSIDGFWASFGAIVFVLPSLGIWLLAEARIPPADGDPAMGDIATYRLIALAAEWLLMPVLFAVLARPLGAGSRYIAFIVVRNWASVVGAAVSALPALLFAAGIAQGDLFLIAQLAAIAVVIYYQYRIVRMVLATTIGVSIAVVIVDLLASTVITEVVRRLVIG